MPGQEDSLFSLELVVEKLYVPHVACRFPAIAFRLLDFPTILISHVEEDLSKTIKSKIERDPYYQLPQQFSELKDTHGNFMVKKGKSCLFKIPVETLKMHLTNTPLYVMIIDAFNESPKLLGNSTIPLNSLMDDICVDIAKLGTTVPSVHGDKGLFKIYSLMGKEIGYFVLGFRLLCLGPGLIPHLPESVLTKRVVKRKVDKVKHADLNTSEVQLVDIQGSEPGGSPRLNDTRDMGSMTDVLKQDAILQTMEFDNKAVHVAISCPDEKAQLVTATTQTEKRKKVKQDQNEYRRFVEHAEDRDDDDGIIINNIVCPPPMFYNSHKDPQIKMQKYLHHDQMSVVSDDLEIEDLESEDSRESPDDNIRKMDSKRQQKELPSQGHQMPVAYQHKTASRVPNDRDDQGRDMFPVLTALLCELTGIQSSHLLEAVGRLPKKQGPPAPSTQPKHPAVAVVTRKRLEELSQPRKPFNKPDPKTDEGSQDKVSADKPAAGRTYRRCIQPPTGVPANKGWLGRRPDQPVKKSQLVFGLTHTQRLRLAKANPGWLKEMEKEEAEMKMKKEQPVLHAGVESDVDLNVTNLSDTLTEVRRLAQRELAKNDTLNSSRGVSTLGSDDDGPKQVEIGKKWLSRYGKQSPSPKRKLRSPRRTSPRRLKSALLARDIRSNVKRTVSHEAEETSQRSDQPSTRSIEVHLPSAHIDDDDGDGSDVTIDDMDMMPEDRAAAGRRQFQGFGKVNQSFPESIDGRVNASLSETKDSDHPLESTRLSTGGPRVKESSEFDTRQFQSTDEPELQGLMSDEENRSDVIDSGRHGRPGAAVSASVNSSIHKFAVRNPVASEQSPVPAVRRSAVMLDLLPSRGNTPQPDTPRSQSQGSSIHPTPRPRRPSKLARESINTDSLSSYQPSEMENNNAVVSLSSDTYYSADFHPAGSEFDDSLTDISLSPDISFPKLIPSAKLGYTA